MNKVLLDWPVKQRLVVPPVKFDKLPFLLDKSAKCSFWMDVRARSLEHVNTERSIMSIRSTFNSDLRLTGA